MSYTLDLSSAWTKFERAESHVRELRAMIRAKLGPDPIMLPLLRHFDPKEGAVVYSIERLIEIDHDWNLLVGEIIHNYRCALDHLAWQIAIRHFNGVPPTAHKVVRNIQFPIITDPTKWATHPHREHMDPADRAKVEHVQPFMRTGPGIDSLEMLAEFSNTDKHRTLQLAYTDVSVAFNNGVRAWRDCKPQGGDDEFVLNVIPFSEPPKAGDEVFLVYVRQLGPNPDVQFDAQLSSHIAIREERMNLDDMFVGFQRTVSYTLNLF